MDAYAYNDILRGLFRDLVSNQVPFFRGENCDITIINEENNREDCIFSDERGLRDAEIVNRTLVVSTENYNHFLYAMNHDEAFRDKYAWPQSCIAKLALILCKGAPKFKKI